MAEALQLGMDVIANALAATPTSAPAPAAPTPAPDSHWAELGCRGLAAHKRLNDRDLFGEISACNFCDVGSLGTEPVARAQYQETPKV